MYFVRANAIRPNLTAKFLCDRSVDLVTCFQAFHWFDPQPTLQEFARILKPSGRLAAVWNNRDRSDEFTREYSLLTQQVSDGNSELRYGTEKYLRDTDWFHRVHHFTFPYQQALDSQALIGRAMSTSYIPRSGEKHQKFVRDLNQLYERHRDRKGLVYLQYQTHLYLTEKSS